MERRGKGIKAKPKQNKTKNPPISIEKIKERNREEE